MISPELLENLLFSATWPEMFPLAPKQKPPKEVRLAHHQARRALIERYGLEAIQKCDSDFAVRRFLLRPGILPTLLGGMMFYMVSSFMRRK
jgi:hypothetical protein